MDYDATSDEELLRIWRDEDLRRAGFHRPPPPEPRPRRSCQPRRPPPPENLERMGFLLQRALRAYRLLLWELYEEVGILPSQEALLVEVYYGREIDPQRDLARRVWSSRASVARSLRRLERAGFLEREPDPEDRRYRLVRLTELGELVIRAGGEALRMAEDAALEDLPPRVLQVLERGLLRVEANCLSTIRAFHAPVPPI